MPGMVGGFLRRNIIYFNNNLKLLALGNTRRAGLISVLYFNENMVEGLRIRRNSQINLKENSKRSVGCVICISLTKVNFHFKIDSSTVVWIDYELRVNGKDILGNRNIIIASLLNIKTGKDLYYIQAYNSELGYICFNEIISQHGNLGNYIFIRICSPNEQKSKPSAFVLYRDLHYFKVIKLGNCNRDGGKIVEKANVESNFSDIRIKSNLIIKNK